MILFQLIDLSLYAVGIYLLYRKRELLLVYLPLLFFIRTLSGTENLIRPFFFYAFISILLTFLTYKSFLISGRKIWLAGLLLVYFIALFLFNNDDKEATRPVFFSMTSLFVTIMISRPIFMKYGKKVILKELYGMSSGIIYLFIPYVIILTVLNIYPSPIYERLQIQLVSNGYIFAAELHTLPIVVFIFGYYRILNKSLSSYALVTIVVASVLIALMFRRAALMVLIISLATIFFSNIKREKISNAFKFAFISAFFLGIALYFTFEFIADGYAARIQTRGSFASTEEGRFVDHVLVYNDMFIRKTYNWLIGHSFFNAPGNYGQGIFGMRNLHADLAVIAHASGLIGLSLYLVLVLKLFKKSYKQTSLHVWSFLLIAFIVFSLSGRITVPAYSISFFLLLVWSTLPSYKKNENG